MGIVKISDDLHDAKVRVRTKKLLKRIENESVIETEPTAKKST